MAPTPSINALANEVARVVRELELKMAMLRQAAQGRDAEYRVLQNIRAGIREVTATLNRQLRMNRTERVNELEGQLHRLMQQEFQQDRYLYHPAVMRVAELTREIFQLHLTKARKERDYQLAVWEGQD